ncbi:MAG: hypothetical protein RL477_1880, partial [Pseudomonadota bacterium]
MTFFEATLALLALTALGYYFGLRRSPARVSGGGLRSQSPKGYYGTYVALWCGLPSLLILLAWVALQPVAVDAIVLAGMPAEYFADKSAAATNLIKAQIHNLAAGRDFGQSDATLVQAAAQLNRVRRLAHMAMFVVVLSAAIGGMTFALVRIRAYFGVRTHVERITTVILIASSTIAILTTVGILVSLLFESARFFAAVPVTEFLFGLNWEPQIPIREGQVAASGAFGAVPVFTGTIMVSAVAMLVAIPVGLMAAIYMSEYATPAFRKVVKPALEILAGIPTIVYGFFAVLTV